MSHSELLLFSICLALLVFLGAFFSAAETGLMAINRYRLRHGARLKKPSAILILNLLKRPDRLLGMILIGNSVSNIFASSITTLLALHIWGEKGVVIATITLTFVILVFSEVAPKTLAALYPERIAKWVSWPVFILLKLFYPVVWMFNAISNGLLRLFRVKVTGHTTEPLSREELRSIVYETSGRLSHQYQNMLLGILDLNQVTVDEVMVPQHEIVGIDLDQDLSVIQNQISQSSFDWLPLYRDNINQIVGMLHVRDLTYALLTQQAFNKDALIKMASEPYFIPEGTPLNVQLFNFQQGHQRTALVVDEYGEIQGLLAFVDIVEEIIGEFAPNVAETNKLVRLQKDGSYLVEGSITVRELNRAADLQLPTEGPRTLNGLIIEYLEAIPKEKLCIKVSGYPIEIMQVEGNRVKIAKVFPALLP